MGILNSKSGRFDESLKADKISTLQALIFASKKVDEYKLNFRNTDKEFSRKDKIMIRMVEAFDLYKEGGRYSYGGPTIEDTVKYIDGSATEQELEELNKGSFNKNYQDGGSLGIWVDSELHLSDLANRVANHEITISRYLSIVFLNLFSYATNDSGEIEYFHFLYKVLNYLKLNENLGWKIDLDSLDKIFYHFIDESTTAHKRAQRRALYQYLVGTEYFVAENENGASLSPYWQKNIGFLISICNQEFKNLSFEEAKEKFKTKEAYSEVLCKNLHENMIAKISEGITVEEHSLTDPTNELVFKTNLESYFSHNRIFFGAPGTGKSFTLDNNKDELLSDGGEYERVTFHPDYSYAQFVGTYKPTNKKSESPFISEDSKKVLDILNDKNKASQEKYDLLYDSFKDGDLTRLPVLLGLYTNEPFKTRKKDGTDAVGDNSVERNHGRAIRPYVNLNLSEQIDDVISYEYVPGPFMRTLVKALNNKKSDNIKPHLLLIEEINRANVAAVFGDVFQLLDRDDSNQSEYPIQASEDMKKYLVKELGGVSPDYAQIGIPNNMFIWASMNSADQGVFPMDTAFKRRWDFTYQGINEGENDIQSFNHKMGGSQVSVNWNDLRKAINAELITYNINEDKLMGAHFVKKESLKDKETFDKTFKSKVIMYLFDDAAKQKRPSLFSGVESPRSFKLYSDICEAYDEIGIDIFSETIKVKFDNQINADVDFEEI